MHEALDRALIRKGELQSLQMRLKERESQIKRLEVLERNQVIEISKLKDKVKRPEGKLRSCDQGIETLMAESAELVDQVMSWEAEEITTKDSLKEAKLLRSADIANAVDEALAKFKSLEEFVVLFKKDHDTRFEAMVEAILYNIWTHYRNVDYTFLGGELTDLIGEWIEEESLNAPNVVPLSVPSDPSTSNVVEIEISLAKTSEEPSMVEVGEVTTTPYPSILPKVSVTEPSSSFAAIQPLINLEEEPVATDVEEEPKAAANPSII